MRKTESKKRPYRHWSTKEKHLVRKWNPFLSVAEIAKKLDRSKDSVQHLRARLALVSSYNKRWSGKEEQLLRNHAGNTPVNAIAEMLGKDVGAVKRWAGNRGISLDTRHKKSHEPEYLTIVNHWKAVHPS